VLAAAGRQQGIACGEVRHGGDAALADEIKGEHIRSAAEPFGHVARQPRAQVARAGADDEGINFIRLVASVSQRAFPGLGGW